MYTTAVVDKNAVQVIGQPHFDSCQERIQTWQASLFYIMLMAESFCASGSKQDTDMYRCMLTT
jgi:hypothetical protein